MKLEDLRPQAAVRGILPDGTVMCCFWALDEDMWPRDERYVLGQLSEGKKKKILVTWNKPTN